MTNKSKFQRVTRIRIDTRPDTEAAPLAAEEERVVRMLHGLGEEGDHELEFQKSPDPEVNARLQLMELALLEQMHGEGQTTDPATPKEKILEHLKSLEESD